MRTDCCNRTICDSSHTAGAGVSNILDICSRNHREYTLCGLHKKECHEESRDWRDCSKCKQHFKFPEMFVGYGTSQYNFELDWLDPPTFEPTHCSQCGELLKLNINMCIVKADGTAICQKHQQLSLSAAKKVLSSGNWKVDSFGIS